MPSSASRDTKRLWLVGECVIGEEISSGRQRQQQQQRRQQKKEQQQQRQQRHKQLLWLQRSMHHLPGRVAEAGDQDPSDDSSLMDFQSDGDGESESESYNYSSEESAGKTEMPLIGKASFELACSPVE